MCFLHTKIYKVTEIVMIVLWSVNCFAEPKNKHILHLYVSNTYVFNMFGCGVALIKKSHLKAELNEWKHDKVCIVILCKDSSIYLSNKSFFLAKIRIRNQCTKKIHKQHKQQAALTTEQHSKKKNAKPKPIIRNFTV